MDVEIRQSRQVQAVELVEPAKAKFSVLVSIMVVPAGKVMKDITPEASPVFPFDVFVNKAVGLCDF
jgi:hypothetical protein